MEWNKKVALKEILSAPLGRNDKKPVTLADLQKFAQEYGTIIIDAGIPRALIGTEWVEVKN